MPKCLSFIPYLNICFFFTRIGAIKMPASREEMQKEIEAKMRTELRLCTSRDIIMRLRFAVYKLEMQVSDKEYWLGSLRFWVDALGYDVEYSDES